MSTSDLASPAAIIKTVKRLPPEVSILGVLLGIAIMFEILGWIIVGDSFLANKQRLSIIILQVSVIGIIAVGVTQVIITGGVDLSSGSIVGLVAMVTASLAQTAANPRAVYPSLTDISPVWAIL
ncbi:MAG TPA: ABC transporter permease, partial [Rhizobiaceae bacterium]|nr:ABC transporter permease [Rhizobiaceae bacterium]